MSIRISQSYARRLGVLPGLRKTASRARSGYEPMLEPSPRPKGRYTLTLSGFLPAPKNQFNRAHWTKRHKLVKECSEIVHYYAREQDIPRAEHKRRVTATFWKPGRPCDVDAYQQVLLDALVRCCLLISDSPAWCELAPWSFATGPRRTVITLEDV